MAAPVSVTFTTAAGADLSGPPQIQSSPASGATGVLTTTVITLTFNKRIDPLSVNSATFKVTPQGSAIPIAGTVAVSGDGLSASFTPASPLAPSTTYSVFGGRFTDLVGQGNFVSFSFTTGTM